MKIDFSQTIRDLEGKPIKMDEGEESKELTLERITVSSLLQPTKEETGESKYKKYCLIKKVHGAAGPVELSSEDVSLVKKVIGESSFTALVTGQSWDLLEGSSSPAKTE